VFLGGGRAFKQVGLCFSAATVLIARYGRTHADESSRTGYTAALAVPTLIFMMAASGAASFLPNLLILAAVWRFATGVTGALSLEDELDPPRRKARLYGLDSLCFEEIRCRREE